MQPAGVGSDRSVQRRQGAGEAVMVTDRRMRTVTLPDGDWWQPLGPWMLARLWEPPRWVRTVTVDDRLGLLLGPVVKDEP